MKIMKKYKIVFAKTITSKFKETNREAKNFGRAEKLAKKELGDVIIFRIERII